MPLQSAFTLNPNDIFASIGNMIISQEVYADNLGKHQTLVDKGRVDGSLFGDKKLYYATDILKTHAWLNDSEAGNLLSIDRPDDPEVQDITLDVFRQIRLTVDNYLTKRAWSDEGSFSAFNSVMLGWMRETKRVYDGTLYNVYIGCTETSTGEQSQTVTLSGTNDGQTIAEKVANILVAMGDYSRDYNDYQFMRSYSPGDVKAVWNSKFVNKIRKVDTPTIFHREGLVDKLDEDVLPAKYFGTIITSSNISSYSDSTPAPGKPIDSDNNQYTPGSNNVNGTLRAAVEKEVTVGGNDYHLFPGEEIPSGATIVASGNFEPGEVYIEDPKVICKLLVRWVPYMSAFEVGTSFFNPRSLTENHYLTFGHNTLEYLKNYPFVTLKQA